MNIYKKSSIKSKLIILILGVNIVSLLIAFTVVITSNIKQYKNEMVKNITLNTQIVGEACKTAITFEDKKGATVTLQSFKSVDEVNAVFLFDKNDKLFADYYKTDDKKLAAKIYDKKKQYYFENKSLHINVPVVHNGQNIGNLHILASTDKLSKRINNYILTMLILVAGLIVLSFIIASMLQRTISKPILNLASISSKISKEANYSLRVEKGNNDEIGVLCDEYNHMLDQIEKRDLAIRESEERLKKMSESAFDAIVLLNEKGEVYFWNKAAESIFGFTAKEIAKKSFYEQLIPSQEFINFKDKISEFNKANKGESIGEVFEFYAKNREGEQFPIEMSTASLVIGDKWHIISIIKDITERKMNEEALRKAKDDAEEADRLKSAFLANMSHEIRTPMNSIIGFADLLRNASVDEERSKKYLGIIHNNGKNLLNLIDDIIDVSKIEAGQLKIKTAEVNINAILAELYSYFNHEIKRKKHNFELILKRANEDQNFTIKTDPFRLRQILGNLLTNAFKFTDLGAIEFGYTFVDKKTLQFYVKDSGIGIAKEKHKVIFDRFGQVDESLNRNTSGTGLGLNIAKRLVELLGGRIWVDSIPEKGSTFYFTIPFVRIEVPEKDLPKNIDNIKYDWSDKVIAIAEDELANFLLIQELLAETNAELIHTKNGEETVEMTEERPEIDIILMDINMPIMDGYEATKLIKEKHKEIAIIAQTAYAMSGERERSLEAGCDDYVTKPLNGPELLATINKHMH